MTSPDQPDPTDPTDPDQPPGTGRRPGAGWPPGADQPAPDPPPFDSPEAPPFDSLPFDALAAPAPDFVRNPPAPRFTVQRPVNDLDRRYADPDPDEAPTIAHVLLDETQGIEELLREVSGNVARGGQRISLATDRRRAALSAPAMLLAREALEAMLDDLAQIDACIDGIRDALGPVVRDEHPRISEARLALLRARGIAETAGESGHEYARIGVLATERVSDFAEADMLHEQILCDLRRRDLAAVDARMPRFVEVERTLVARGVTAKLVEVRRRREELAAGGRGDAAGRDAHHRHEDHRDYDDNDDDYTI